MYFYLHISTNRINSVIHHCYPTIFCRKHKQREQSLKKRKSKVDKNENLTKKHVTILKDGWGERQGQVYSYKCENKDVRSQFMKLLQRILDYAAVLNETVVLAIGDNEVFTWNKLSKLYFWLIHSYPLFVQSSFVMISFSVSEQW